MPTLTLKLTPPLDANRCEALASGLTDLAARLLQKQAQLTAVLIEPLPATRWYIGGRPVEGVAAQLEISVSANSNSEREKASFIEAAFAELKQRLAPDGQLDPVSYVIVRELPRTDWGYGGRTQAARATPMADTSEARPRALRS